MHVIFVSLSAARRCIPVLSSSHQFIFPSVDREGTWRLMELVLRKLVEQASGRDYMFNRVLEVGENGTIRTYKLPPP
jgi:hypothetical protein